MKYTTTMDNTMNCDLTADVPMKSRTLSPERKNLRATFHNYSGGDYFITICTKDRKHYLGKIKDGKMLLSKIGLFATKALTELPTHYRYSQVPLFVVMPNHIHAIICIAPSIVQPDLMPAQRPALSVIVGGFKQSVTAFARRNNIEFAWQSRFHDHIIRDIVDGNNISDYIQNNVAKWDSDCFNDKQP